MNKKNKNWITCGIIALVLLCIGIIVLLVGLGVLGAIIGEGDAAPADNTTTQPTPVLEEPTLVDENLPAVQDVRPTHLYESVVQIIAVVDMNGQTVAGWTGSGSIISSDGLILTNAHVVLSDKFYDVQDLIVAFTVDPDYPAEPRYYAEVMQADEGLDLAVIRITTDLDGNPVDNASLGLPAVPLGDSDALELGGELTILGYPGIGGETITLTDGKVGGFTSEDGVGQRAFIKTSATISGGNSGGLAVNAAEELIGVPTQLGYGGEDQFVDCRSLADTNRDGVIDDNDSCVPTGGFINALRPINLAIPLIEAAQRGEVNFVAAEPTPQAASPVQPSGILLLQDDFENSYSGWSEQNTSTGYSEYREGQYVVQVNEPNYDLWGNYENEQFGDVIINVDVAVLQSANGTGGFGVMCRYVDNDNYYKLEVDEDGYFILYKYEAGEYFTLYDWDHRAWLQGLDSMHLTASCIRDELTLAVNDTVLASVTDDSFDYGYIGLASDVFDDPGIRVGFDNLTVYAP